jgi:Fe-S-cluster containining protein
MPILDFAYPKKIRFNCIKCGICCGDTENKVRMILLLEPEIKHIANEVSLSIDYFASKVDDFEPYGYMMKKRDGKCFFLHDKQCSIYEKRPLICRFYPFQLINLGDSHYVFKETSECPGINNGLYLGKDYFKKMFEEAASLMQDRRK